MVGRTTVGALVLLTGSWGLWSAFAERRMSASAPPAVSAADARQRELLKLNIDKPGDPELMAMFAAVSANHFGGALPATPVRWEARLSEVGTLANGAFNLEGLFGHIGERTAILLNPDLRSDKRALDRALCHEVVHAYLYSKGESTETHGAAFQTVLRRLSDEGAFEGILAGAGERTNLRAWLVAESARLDAEHDAMMRLARQIEREGARLERDVTNLNERIATAHADPSTAPSRSEIDAVNHRRDVYSARATEVTERGERATAALAEFNRQVARYNLMLVYPDGVDEDALLKPKAAEAASRRP